MLWLDCWVTEFQFLWPQGQKEDLEMAANFRVSWVCGDL